MCPSSVEAKAKSEPEHQPVQGARRNLLIYALGLSLLLAVMLERAFRYWAFTLDDAFITLRYAKHLAEGLGPSWNPGAEPAEGYTTALWMVLLGVAQLLGIDGLWFAKGSGLVFGLGAIACAARLAQRTCQSLQLPELARAVAPIAVFALAVSYWPLSLHAISGMETTFSCLMITWFFYASVSIAAQSAHHAPSSLQRQLALAALLCTLTRPEAGLLCVASLTGHLAFDPASARKALLREVALWFVLPGALYLAVRWWHFGLLFPLSFYVKATNKPSFAGLPDVLGFFEPFVLQQPWWGALFLWGAWRVRALRAALIGAASFVVFFVFPEHIMAFESRYLLPLFPFFAAVAGVGAARSSQQLERFVAMSARAPWLRFAPIALLMALAWLPAPNDQAARAQNWVDYGISLRKAHVALARDLAPAQGRGGRIALLDVGAIGYYADWHTIDTFGLNDAHVALAHREDVAYVLAKQPDLLVVVSNESGTYRELFEWETPLYRQAVAQGYRPECEYTFDPNYHLQVLARPGAKTVRGNVCASSSRKLGVEQPPS
jgi:hypothetical protein